MLHKEERHVHSILDIDEITQVFTIVILGIPRLEQFHPTRGLNLFESL